MTSYLDQLPGELPIQIVDGNDLNFKLDWQTDTSLFNYTCWIQPVGSVKTIIPITMATIDATLGTYTASVSKTALANLPLNTAHKWRMDRTTATSTLVVTVLAGSFTVLDK
jgi:hypothetical protein